MNILNSLKVYAAKWAPSQSGPFSQEDIDKVIDPQHVAVVSSQYGNSACFMLKSGGQSYVPMSIHATVTAGETFDMTKATVLQLKRGEEIIYRIEI